MAAVKRLFLIWAFLCWAQISIGMQMLSYNGEHCLDGNYLGKGRFSVSTQEEDGKKVYELIIKKTDGSVEVTTIEIDPEREPDDECIELKKKMASVKVPVIPPIPPIPPVPFFFPSFYPPRIQKIRAPKFPFGSPPVSSSSWSYYEY